MKITQSNSFILERTNNLYIKKIHYYLGNEVVHWIQNFYQTIVGYLLFFKYSIFHLDVVASQSFWKRRVPYAAEINWESQPDILCDYDVWKLLKRFVDK